MCVIFQASNGSESASAIEEAPRIMIMFKFSGKKAATFFLFRPITWSDAGLER